MSSTTLAPSQSPALQAGTLAALRYPHFRLYFIGQVISLSGTWMQVVAQGWLVFHLTQSELWLGVVACAAGLPALLLSPFAGVVVDRFPRRKILICSQIAQMILAFSLAALTFANVVQVWHIVVLALLLGVINAIDAPARHAIIIDLVGHKELTSGIALNSIMFNGSRVFGPAAAGIALTQVGPAWCFLLNGLSFLAVIFMLSIIRTPNAKPSSDDTPPLERLKQGIRFVLQHPTIGPLILLAIVASLFTGNLSTLLPSFADTVLHSPKEAYAAMSTATGVGAVLAGILLAPLGRRFGRGRVIVVMGIAVMFSTLLFSQSTDTTPASLLMVAFGFSIILQFTTVNTLIQNLVPDELRGRVMSLYTLTWFGLSPFGSLILGLSAQLIGTPTTIVIFELIGGGIIMVILLRCAQVRRLA